jgi:hypothetical protein
MYWKNILFIFFGVFIVSYYSKRKMGEEQKRRGRKSLNIKDEANPGRTQSRHLVINLTVVTVSEVILCSVSE